MLKTTRQKYVSKAFDILPEQLEGINDLAAAKGEKRADTVREMFAEHLEKPANKKILKNFRNGK